MIKFSCHSALTRLFKFYREAVTDGEGVGLLPGEGRPPGVQPHLLGQRLWDGQQDEADVGQSDERGQQDHQVVSVPRRQVCPDGRTRHQAGCERGRHLRGGWGGGSGSEERTHSFNSLTDDPGI